MARVVFAPPLGPEFDPFLCAFIGADPNGTMLSLLSAYARSDVDPWKEAAQLARMPRETAAARLAAFILALPNQPQADKPVQTIASELVTLLPSPARLGSPTPSMMTKTLSVAQPSFGISLGAVAFLVGFAFLFWINNRSSEPAASPPPPRASATTLTPREMGR